MAPSKSESTVVTTRGEPLRQRVLDAAERLLSRGKAEFSMRDLAVEAVVSFATPFNQFGSKAAIMQALSGRRIDEMEARYRARCTRSGAADRVLQAVDMAVVVMSENPTVNRAVMGCLGTSMVEPGQIWARSTALWKLALGAGEGLIASRREQALTCLPQQLAFGFRGVLSFWTAGEVTDEMLATHARSMASTLLLGFADPPLLPCGSGP